MFIINKCRKKEVIKNWTLRKIFPIFDALIFDCHPHKVTNFLALLTQEIPWESSTKVTSSMIQWRFSHMCTTIKGKGRWWGQNSAENGLQKWTATNRYFNLFNHKYDQTFHLFLEKMLAGRNFRDIFRFLFDLSTKLTFYKLRNFSKSWEISENSNSKRSKQNQDTPSNRTEKFC